MVSCSFERDYKIFSYFFHGHRLLTMPTLFIFSVEGDYVLSIGGYIKLILKKRGLTVAELARMMTEQERKHESKSTIYRMHLNQDIKYDKISIERARKIEITLNLPKYQLVNLINPSLTDKQIDFLENVYKKEQ